MPDLRWIADSRKAKVALGSVASIVLTRVLKHFGLGDADANAITASIVTIGGVWIASIAHEDAAAKGGGDKGPQEQERA